MAEAEATVARLRRRVAQLERVEIDLRAARRENRVLMDRNRILADQIRSGDAALALALRAVEEIKASSSWRITAPVRAAKGVLRLTRLGLSAWLLFKPGSRPRRAVRRLMVALGLWPRGQAQASPAVEAVDAETQTGPKSQILYVVLGSSLSDGVPSLGQTDARALCAELTESAHSIRLVKWDVEADACILLDREELARLAQHQGPLLAPEELSLYPAPGGVVRANPRAGSSSWLISVDNPGADTSALIDWAKGRGLKCGFIVHEPALEDVAHVAALSDADAVWPTSAWAAERLGAAWGGTSAAQVQAIRPPRMITRPRVLHARPSGRAILCDARQTQEGLPALVAAFCQALAARPDSGWELVVAGEVSAEQPAHVRMAGPVDAAGMANLYANCAFAVAPGNDEASQEAVLQSLWEARPCVASSANLASKEDGCVAADVSDLAAFAGAIGRLMDDQGLRAELSEKAVFRQARQWSDYCADLEAAGPGAKPLIYYWVDSTIAVPVNTGIQRVVRQLARGLIEAGFDVVPVKWGSLDQPLYPVFDNELEHLAKWNGPAPDSWHAWVDPRTHRGGGWFMMNELPHNLAGVGQKAFREAAENANLKTAAVFYDTIPFKMADIYPEEFSRLHLSYIRELANYDKVIAISQYSRDELKRVLVEEFQIPHDRLDHIVASPLAAEFPERAEQEAAPRRRDDGAIEILCVGTVEPRKNHERLLDAFDIACGTSPVPLHLTIVGGGHSFEPDLAVRVQERVDNHPHIDWEQKADDARIKQLYGRCDFTIYPSVEEGFGMPILESLWYGKPVICAQFGAMMEVAADGGGCVTIDVTDAVAMASALVDLASSPDRLRKLAAEAKVRDFQTWQGYTRDVAGQMGLTMGRRP